jgi:hypothetical protein
MVPLPFCTVKYLFNAACVLNHELKVLKGHGRQLWRWGTVSAEGQQQRQCHALVYDSADVAFGHAIAVSKLCWAPV